MQKHRSLLASLALLSVAILVAPDASWAKPKYGPDAKPLAAPLWSSNAYLRSSPKVAPDFWNMIGYYVPQVTPSSCSAASVAMVLNAALASKPKTSDDKVVLQPDLVEKVKIEQWKDRVSTSGASGKFGVSLDQLGKITEAAFKAYGFPQAKVRVVHTENTSAETKKALIADLENNEKGSQDFIIANFDQQNYTDDAQAGHIAPIGAYDAKGGRVLVMDPDREYYEPYWVSVDTFLKGMATKDSEGKTFRGYLVVQTGK
jgi:hypothetical protein